MATIPVSDRSISYEPVNATGPFPIDFPVFDGEGADLLVTLNDVEASGWTFSGTVEGGFYGAPNTWVNGSITFSAPVTGALVIEGRRDPRRQGQYAEGRGVPARDQNTEFNILTATAQELWRELRRVVRVPRGETGITLPKIADRSGKWAAYGSDGSALAVDPPAVVVGDGRADFATAQAAIGASLPSIQLYFRTAGFYEAGDGGGALYRIVGDEPSHEGKIPLAGGKWGVLSEKSVNPRQFGAIGDGVADDYLPLQAWLGSGWKDLYLDPGIYIISHWLRLDTYEAVISGPRGAVIRMDPDRTENKIQPALVVTSAAYGCRLRGFTLDHQGSLWPVYPAANFVDDLMGGPSGGGGDAKGVCLLFMADSGSVEDVSIFNGWDCGGAFGKFDMATGAQSAGPESVRVHNTWTFNNGCGGHAWGDAPGGAYYQGAGIDFLTATNFECFGCIDYGSRGGFWADTAGGGRGHFVNCTSVSASRGEIWSDDAIGGNQPWFTGGFAGTVTGAGAGWKKTPGGAAFYSGTYGVHFENCTAWYPALYGLGIDAFALNNVVSNFRVVGSEIAGIINAGRNSRFSNIVLEGCCRSIGVTAPSGSTCPNFDAMMHIGSHDGGVTYADVHGLTVDGLPTYPGVPRTVFHHYAVSCLNDVGFSGNPAFVRIMGARCVAGTSGEKYYAQLGTSRLSVLEGDASDWDISAFGVPLNLNLRSDDGSVAQFTKAQNGDLLVTNYGSGKQTVISQAGPGAILFGSGGALRAEFGAVMKLTLPTSATGLPSGVGALWNDGGTVKVVP